MVTNNKSVATVDKTSGKVTAKSDGTAVISAKYNKTTYKCAVKVVDINKTVATQTAKPAQIKLAPISIIKFSHSIDTVGGVQWNFMIRNNSDKDIKYITMAWYCYNSVGDPITDKMSGYNNVKVKYTGSLASKEPSTLKKNSTKFYNSSFSQYKFYQFDIEYMDGTKVMLSTANLSKYYGILPGDTKMPAEVVVSEKFGDNIKWTLNNTGLFEITGAGEMPDIMGA